MRLITERDRIRNVSALWGFYHSRSNDKRKADIGNRLAALDLNVASADDVKKIIGNSFLTQLKCDECAKGVKAVISVGDGGPDYESKTAHLCFECIKKAADMTYNAR